jgi:hypothetical protein
MSDEKKNNEFEIEELKDKDLDGVAGGLIGGCSQCSGCSHSGCMGCSSTSCFAVTTIQT